MAVMKTKGKKKYSLRRMCGKTFRSAFRVKHCTSDSSNF